MSKLQQAMDLLREYCASRGDDDFVEAVESEIAGLIAQANILKGNAAVSEQSEKKPSADARPVDQRARPLVERLRQVRHVTRWTRGLDTDYPVAWEPDPLCQEAATEIERLRKALSDILEYDTRVMYERCPDCWSEECKKLGRCRDVPLIHAGKIAHAALAPNADVTGLAPAQETAK